MQKNTYMVCYAISDRLSYIKSKTSVDILILVKGTRCSTALPKLTLRTKWWKLSQAQNKARFHVVLVFSFKFLEN